MIYYQDNHNALYCMDFRKNDLPDESVQCVVTSPPYWGLRKYSGEQELIWGGDKDCEHKWNELKTLEPNAMGGQGYKQDTNIGSQHTAYDNRKRLSGTCSLCGAWKGAYGLEPTPEMYIQHTIEILREIRRVLRKDGVVFWNIGDSYAANRSYQVTDTKWRDVGNTKASKVPEGLKPKDLCLIPFRVAIAAQSDGWWVRSVIIWSKNNPMPESVTDRPTESHEYILMLTKSGTSQYWTHSRKRGSRTKPKPDYIWAHKRTGLVVDYQPVSDRILREFWRRSNLWRGHDYYWDAEAVREKALIEPRPRLRPNGIGTDTSTEGLGSDSGCGVGTGRNIRSVWEFPTQPFTGWQRTSRLCRVELGAVSDGMMHIVSPYCPVHEGLFGQVASDFCDGYASDLLSHILHSDSHPAQERQADCEPTLQSHASDFEACNWGCSHPQYCSSAIVHNRQNYKTGLVPETNLPCMPFAEMIDHTDDKRALLWSFLQGHGNGENSILLDEMDAHLQGRIPHRIVGKSSLPIPPSCICSFYHKTNQETSHFAVFPEKLPELCIKAATPEVGCCSKCGSPWVRVTERVSKGKSYATGKSENKRGSGLATAFSGYDDGSSCPEFKTIGWLPTCKCNADKVPSICLDPFMGAGTTLWVAKKLNRRAIGFDTSEEYCQLAVERNRQQVMI